MKMTRDIKIAPDDPVYVIGVVSRLLEIPEWTLRSLEKEGLVRPKRSARRCRMYSFEDIKRIEYIYYLMEEKGVNIRGVKVILEMEA
jgi:MerR family transcriptional regulator/heat shock protein HspR